MLNRITYIFKNILITGVLFCFIVIPSLSGAQVSRSVFFLSRLPSSNLVNPAHHPDSKFYVNLPVVSTFYLGFESPFSFDNLTKEWPGGDSLYIDREGIMNSLDEHNYFSFEYYNELGRIGFGTGRHYFHFNIAKVFSTKFSFPKELIGLMLYGNADPRYFGQKIDLDQIGLNMQLYHEFAIGYSFRINKKLTIGTRLKYLNGSFNVWTEKAKFTLYTDNEPNFPITATSDIVLRTSSTISDFDNLIDQVEGYKWFDLTDNHGFGFDLGVVFKPVPEIKISASLVDVGKIQWKENLKTFHSANPGLPFIFSGFDINDFIQEGSFSDTLDFADTLINHFRLEETHESYSSHLNPKIYLGGIWSINKNNELGIMARGILTEEKIQPSLTFNYTHHFGDVMSIYGNYSLMPGNYTNIGLGLVLKFGPVQFYALNDMVYAVIKPREARNYNFHVGMNFMFGKIKEPKFKGISVPDENISE